ncbi:MAG: hypothetical protein FWH11_00055 [Micrococcales bacterium]|nr:hypothetical protein [Micrococcales bacterium]
MYYWLEAEVAGGFGDGIDYRYDRTPRVLPPMCYEFQGWDGGCIVTTSPVWIASDRLVHELRAREMTGLEFAGKVVVTRDPQWAEMRPDVQLPEWEWIIPRGVEHQDDFWLKESVWLAVSERALALIQELGIGSGMEFPEDVYPDGPPRLDIPALRAEYRRRGLIRPSDTRATWTALSYTPRPQVDSVEQFDLTQHPEVAVPSRPSAKYEVSLPGEIEVDYYTDPAGRVQYVETVRGTIVVPNPVLDAPQPDVTYVVHPVDGRYAMVLRTDTQARLVEIVADPLAPAGTYGPGGHPFTALFGAWPGQVSPRALLESASGPATDGLTVLAQRLIDATNHGQRAAVRIRAFYADTSAVPSQLQVDWTADGQSASELFANT